MRRDNKEALDPLGRPIKLSLCGLTSRGAPDPTTHYF